MDTKTNAKICAMQFDAIYKADKSADFIQFVADYRATNGIKEPQKTFESMVYAEYAKI